MFAILSFLENEFVAILAILGIIVPALLTLLSVKNYTAFDRKLVPRNKSTIIYIKQLIGTFIFTIPVIILSAYYVAFLGYKVIGFTSVYVILYIIFTIYLISKGISFWQWCIKYKPDLPQYPKLFLFNGQYKVHVTIIFTFAVVSYFATSHLEMKVVAILTNEFMMQVLAFSFIDCIICIFILVPLFTQSSEVNYKLIYEDDVIDAASLKGLLIISL